jgi:serine/threonine protein kinase
METFGRYQLLEKLGQGGMAEVFLAQLVQGEVAKQLAIKRLLPAYSASQRVVKRLASEARLAVWLTHPNIVQVFDFGKVAGFYYIAMEYVDGCDLRALLQTKKKGEGRRLPIKVALELGYRMMDALRYAHACTDSGGKPLGIIHRDVSPHNILLSRDGHPKLADFGMARGTLSADKITQPGTVLGKFSYIAPEQARGLPCDQRVDIFSAGAVIYEMLTGKKAFPRRLTPKQAKNLQLPSAPSERRAAVSHAVDELVLRAMALQPEDRFEDAGAMAEALHAQLETMGGPPKPSEVKKLVAETLGQPEPERDVPEEDLQVERSVSLSLDEYEVSDDSLIGDEVTEVQQQMPGFLGQLRAELAAVERQQQEPSGQAQEQAPVPELAEAEATSKWDSTGERSEEPETASPTASEIPLPSAAQDTEPDRETPGLRRSGTWLMLVWGLGTAAALLIFGLGVMVGRWTTATAPADRHQTGPAPGETTRPSTKVQEKKEAKKVTAVRRVDQGTTASKASKASEKVATPPETKPDSGLEEITLKAPPPGAAKKAAVRPKERRRPPRQAKRTKRKPGFVLLGSEWDDAVEMLKTARQAYVSGQYTRANALAKKVLRTYPESDTAWRLLGVTSCHLKRAKDARRAILRIDPSRRELLRKVCSRNGIQLY